MATTFNVFNLGIASIIDADENDTISENASALVGATFGSTSAPLVSKVQTFSPGSTGFGAGAANAYDPNNNSVEETFKIDGGANRVFDAAAIYNATITYTDGTSATITAVVFQDTNGHTFLAPETTASADQTALEAKPIMSLRLDSVSSNNFTMTANREPGNYANTRDGTVDGTTGNDAFIQSSQFADNDGDAIDGADGNDDNILAGAGNDTVAANLGDDTISGGSGRDLLYGGSGNDSILGGTGGDLIRGDGLWVVLSDHASGTVGSATTLTVTNGADSAIQLKWIDFNGSLVDYAIIQPGQTVSQPTQTAHNWVLTDLDGDFLQLIEDGNQTITYGSDGLEDTLEGGEGNDTISGQFGDDSIFGGAGSDLIYGGSGNDRIEYGTGNDQVYGGDGDDFIDDAPLSPTDTGTNYIDAGAGADTVFGGAGNDTIIGGTGNDSIGGSLGNDTIDGNDGEDYLGGDEGNDLLRGGAGQDTLSGGIGDDSLFGNSGDDMIYGGTGIDLIFGNDGADTLYGWEGDDRISGGSGNDSLFGEAGNDTLSGGEGEDLLDGGDGSDKLNLYYNSGTDTIIGGEGGADDDEIEFHSDGSGIGVNVTFTSNETGTFNFANGNGNGIFSEIERFFGTSAVDSVNATQDSSGLSLRGWDGNDTLRGGAGADQILGEDDNDFLVGNGGDDTILGGSGNDTITGGEGSDSLAGGDGNDTLFYTDSDAAVSVSLKDNTASGGHAAGDTISGFEGISGSAFDDFLAGSDTSDDVLIGGSGNDTIRGWDGDDDISGGDGNDSLIGDIGADILGGGRGNDTLESFQGAATLIGNDDADTFKVWNGSSAVAPGADFAGLRIIGGEGGVDEDVIRFDELGSSIMVTYAASEEGIFTDRMNAANFFEIEALRLSDFDDSVDGTADTVGLEIYGGLGGDTIHGGSGDDFIDGGDGDDFLTTGTGNDTLLGGDGNDTLMNSDGDDSLVGGAGDDSIVATGGNDTLEGGDGNDTLAGGADNDSIDGGAGDDLIEGGVGDDTLTGGDGNDVFVYAAGDGSDTITDFNNGNTGTLTDGDSTNNDYIDLSGFYDKISELHADQADDGVLNQSNTTGPDAVDYSDNQRFASGEGITFSNASADNSSFTSENTGVVCFTTGTAIRTPQGNALIENLKIGDLVCTMDNGPKPIIWIGYRHIPYSSLMRDRRLYPVLIEKGVMGAARDLLVSRQHGMLLGQDNFARAAHLTKSIPGIRIAAGKKQVTYIHLMLEEHQVLFAENIPSESFYPGPIALEMLDGSSKKSLTKAFQTFDILGNPECAIPGYGDTARNFFQNRAEVSSWLKTDQQRMEAEIRRWDIDLEMEKTGKPTNGFLDIPMHQMVS